MGGYFDKCTRGAHFWFCLRPIWLCFFLTLTVCCESKISISFLYFTAQLLLSCFYFLLFLISNLTHSSLSTPWEIYPLMSLNGIHIIKPSGSFSGFILLNCLASFKFVDYSVLPETIFRVAIMTPHSLFSFYLSGYFLLLVSPLLYTIKCWHF